MKWFLPDIWQGRDGVHQVEEVLAVGRQRDHRHHVHRLGVRQPLGHVAGAGGEASEAVVQVSATLSSPLLAGGRELVLSFEELLENLPGLAELVSVVVALLLTDGRVGQARDPRPHHRPHDGLCNISELRTKHKKGVIKN